MKILKYKQKNIFLKIVINLFQIYQNYILKMLLLKLNFNGIFINCFQQHY